VFLQPQKHIEQCAVSGSSSSLPPAALVDGAIHQLEQLGVQRLGLAHRAVNGSQQEHRRREQVARAELGAPRHGLVQRGHELFPPPEPLAHDGAQDGVGHVPGNQLADVDQLTTLAAGARVRGDGAGEVRGLVLPDGAEGSNAPCAQELRRADPAEPPPHGAVGRQDEPHLVADGGSDGRGHGPGGEVGVVLPDDFACGVGRRDDDGVQLA